MTSVKEQILSKLNETQVDTKVETSKNLNEGVVRDFLRNDDDIIGILIDKEDKSDKYVSMIKTIESWIQKYQLDSKVRPKGISHNVLHINNRYAEAHSVMNSGNLIIEFRMYVGGSMKDHLQTKSEFDTFTNFIKGIYELGTKPNIRTFVTFNNPKTD